MKLADLLETLSDDQGFDLYVNGEKYPTVAKTAKIFFSDAIRHMYVDKIVVDSHALGLLAITLE